MNKTLINQPQVIQNPQINARRVFDALDVNEATRADYKYRVGMFLDFVKNGGFNRNSFLEFKRHLASKPDFSVATKNKYLATAKIFLKELNRQGILSADITQNIKTFSQSKKHKREGLNDEEIMLLAEKMKQMSPTPHNTRLRAIFSLLALQGLRQAEIVRLDIKDIDIAGRLAFIQGKGRDDKESINLHPETARALKDYLRTAQISDGALFVSRSNNSRNHRLTTKALRTMVKDVLINLGIDKSTHGFRHYFTTTLIKTYKGDLLEVAQYTRHRSLEMLQVYNDNIKHKADLPRFYRAFRGVNF
ncbi:integrase [Candidatus Giovannonibacteria bacterium RIFCSPHIGHO2_02_FULL_45_40]|uniref:Integrase n=1 Tax=Candidatus Giovannonibacteria bacterium RIFCSPHIGHO2_02_FULL_45_40 TaxID=1798337 RepID=A0A1F5WAA5_9BACT|nr:MAG: integrase [Candidatus Giovannonibacteria bacterium RIFCSPHIGHO2_01_45_12]OGF60535.1 MAG: integrase [Candidatus Giovannonibacteria bacterium RIFCSPHIGHO2_01_FULL_44_100]OGF72602.1 MAG: integrase [Candidatus Giovannonibacteria bacterium RIFCSPHIGHO2_02_FULL_45_40]